MSRSGTVSRATAAGMLFLVASCPTGDVLAGSSEQASKVSLALSIYATMDEKERAALKRAIGQRPERKGRQRMDNMQASRPGSASTALAALPNATETFAAPARAAGHVPPSAERDDAPNNAHAKCRGFVPLLRKDWKDIGIANCPQDVAKATGAEISYSRDQIKQNANWSLDGTAALLYNFAGAGSYYTSTGGYVTANRSTNSAVSEADANADKLAYGGVFEYGTVTSGDVYSANYFRLRGGGVEDRIRQTTASNLTFEWLPVYDDYSRVHIHSPFKPFAGLPLIVRFDPSLLVQYAGIVNGSRPLAFNDRSRALRIGPQLTMTLYPGTSDFFSHFAGSVSYHWAYEAYSGRGLSLFQSSLTYNLDKDGYIGLTGSYGRGHDEDTGARSDIYKISLTGKI